MSYEDPVNQRAMVLDDRRNASYERALASLVTPDTVVLDAGSGLGVLGFIAARLGARKVYMIEPATNLEAVKLIALQNGLQDRVELIKGTVEQAVIPEKVDIITSVFTGNFMLEEDLLPVLFRARDAFLKEGGVLLPGAGRMITVPVSLQDYYDRQIGCWKSKPGKIDHSPMHQFAVNQIYYDTFSGKPFRKLAEESVVCEIDFFTAQEAGCDATLSFTVTASGDLHGFLGWFDMSFEGERLSTSPEAPATHWSQAFLPVDPVVRVSRGDFLELSLHRPENGEWSWALDYKGTRSQHSTFLSTPFTPAALERKSLNFRPGLNDAGQALRLLLERFDGQQSLGELAQEMLGSFPGLFFNEEAALKFVRRQVDRFGK